MVLIKTFGEKAQQVISGSMIPAMPSVKTKRLAFLSLKLSILFSTESRKAGKGGISGIRRDIGGNVQKAS
jgi:hypothetical protein